MRHRAGPGEILPEDDPRVRAAVQAIRPMVAGTDQFEPDWRDVAEIVNVVLAVDDAMAEQ